jgi:hypothetical protein
MWILGRRRSSKAGTTGPEGSSSRQTALVEKRERPWGQPWWLPTASFLLKVLITVAILTLIGITLLFVARLIRPDLTAPIEGLGLDLEDNFNNSVVFFWLEAVAVVAVIKGYEATVERLGRRRLFHQSFELMRSTINHLHELRYQFAVALDTSPSSRRPAYMVDYVAVNQRVHEIRAEVILRAICSPAMTDHSRFLVDRLMRELDIMVASTHRIASQCRARQAAIRIEQDAPASPADDAEDRVPPGPPERDEELEAHIEALFEAIDPDRGSIGDLPDQVEQGSELLRYRRRRREGGREPGAMSLLTPRHFWSHDREDALEASRAGVD